MDARCCTRIRRTSKRQDCPHYRRCLEFDKCLLSAEAVLRVIGQVQDLIMQRTKPDRTGACDHRAQLASPNCTALAAPCEPV
jgi:hypothetical protein